MQLASIPKPVLAANQQVLGSLQQASALTSSTQATVEKAGITDDTAPALQEALGHAQDAAAGVRELGSKNLLDGTFQRYATHAARQLGDAVKLLDRAPLSEDGVAVFTKTLFDAEVATRLGSEAGVRSLDDPSPRALERARSTSGSGSGSSGGPTWVDGAWIDELGNPTRGGDTWTGPDGERFGSDGSPAGSGGWVGPDGQGYDGI